MNAKARLNSESLRNVTGGLLGIMLATLVTTSVEAGTLYWGGGNANITGPQALPTELGNLSGTWNTTLENWAVDSNGTSYQAWSNTGTSNTAYFGAGMTTFANHATNTLSADITVNMLDIRNPSGATKSFSFTAASPVTMTLNGTTPTLNETLGYSDQWAVRFLANVNLAGTAGLKFLAPGVTGLCYIWGDASQLTGPVEVTGNASARLAFMPGSKLGATDIRLRSGYFLLQSTNGANNTAFADNMVVSFLNAAATFGTEAWAGIAGVASTETLGKIILQCGFGNLFPQPGLLNNRSGGSGTNGKFILGDATLGIDRGPHGKGMLAFYTENDDTIRTDLVVSNGVATGVLPWVMSSYGRLGQLDPADKVLKAYANTDTPSTDPNVWIPGSDYRLITDPTATLNNDLSLGSFTAFSGNAKTLTIAPGKTLTLTRGILGAVMGGTTLTITDGTLTTPASEFYINLGGNPSSWLTLNSQLAGTFDVIIGGASTKAFIGGTNANTYTGTTYVNGPTVSLKKPDTALPAIPGDLIVNSGLVYFSPDYAPQQIARNANITIEEFGTLKGGDAGRTADFGGIVTLNGGGWYGSARAITHNAFDAPGTGLRFNGGRFGNYTTSGSLGNYYLLTDVSYASTSTKQAVFENTSGSQLLRLSEAGKGAAVRTFSITNSTTLDTSAPEMVMYMALTEANSTEKAGLTKTGFGTLAVRGMAYNLSGDITVNEGTLVSAGSWTAASRAGTTVTGSSAITGLSQTDDLIVGQLVTGTGIPASTTITNIDSATEVLLSQAATASGSPSLAFAGRAGMVRRIVRDGSITLNNYVITGLSSTIDLTVGQFVTGTGIESDTKIASIDSASQITVASPGGPPSQTGLRTLTFHGGSALGRGPVTVNSTGTLMGDGVAGIATNNSGGTIDAGTAPNQAATMQFGTNLVFMAGSTQQVDIASDSVSDQLQVYGDITLAGTVNPNLLGSYVPSEGSWIIATYTGTATGSMEAPGRYLVTIDSGNKQIVLTKRPNNTGFVIGIY